MAWQKKVRVQAPLVKKPMCWTPFACLYAVGSVGAVLLWFAIYEAALSIIKIIVLEKKKF
ncbi:hypothetical protein LJC56_01810 [Christensenellaceae bacterium OttesenSCG-928-K19]|nr:hypothetical protein [Christensenellaceae bacterium OttesenSCG-928-K19]